MTNQDELNQAVRHFAAQGHSLADVAAQMGQRYPQASVADLAVALRPLQQRPAMRRAEAEAMAITEDNHNDDVAAATQLAEALKMVRPNVTASDIAQALRSPGVYPNLTAYEMGTVLKSPGVFPTISAGEMTTALQTASYAQPDIDSAVGQLFPAAQIRKIGPAGVQSMPFDDTDAARSLGQPLTMLRLHHGNIVDAIQAFYGSAHTELPRHGGGGGGGTDVPIDDGDSISQVSGYYGNWFGGNYILQLTIQTKNGKTYGPYGDMTFSGSRTPFSLAANPNEKVIALFGSTAYGNNGQSLFLGSLGLTASS